MTGGGGGGVTRTEELGAWRCREVITDDPGVCVGRGGSYEPRSWGVVWVERSYQW